MIAVRKENTELAARIVETPRSAAGENLTREDQSKPLTLAPDLVVQLVSPRDFASKLNAQVENDLASGVIRVVVIYPRTGVMLIHRADGSVTKYPKKLRTNFHGDR